LNTLVGNLLVWLVASLSLASKSCMSPGRLSVHLGVSVHWRVVLPEVRILSEPTCQIYTDLRGRFPIRSNRGNQYIFVLYDYDSNAILARHGQILSHHRSNASTVICRRRHTGHLRPPSGAQKSASSYPLCPAWRRPAQRHQTTRLDFFPTPFQNRATQTELSGTPRNLPPPSATKAERAQMPRNMPPPLRAAHQIQLA
jgi:hypothetical protein